MSFFAIDGKKSLFEPLHSWEAAVQPALPDSIEYGPLIRRLTAHACRFLNTCQAADTERVIPGVGLSPEDFAIHVVEIFAVGELLHDGSKGAGGLIRHLTVAMERDILDALDRAEHKRADFLDPVVVAEEREERQGKALADLADEADDLPAWLDGEAFKAKVYAWVENDPDLKEMAVAIFEINALKPREIAAVCITTETDIQNRKKRFDRLLRQQGYKPKEGG